MYFCENPDKKTEPYLCGSMMQVLKPMRTKTLLGG